LHFNFTVACLQEFSWSREMKRIERSWQKELATALWSVFCEVNPIEIQPSEIKMKQHADMDDKFKSTYLVPKCNAFVPDGVSFCGSRVLSLDRQSAGPAASETSCETRETSLAAVEDRQAMSSSPVSCEPFAVLTCNDPSIGQLAIMVYSAENCSADSVRHGEGKEELWENLPDFFICTYFPGLRLARFDTFRNHRRAAFQVFIRLAMIKILCILCAS
jgi:hypothetical protein